MAYSTPYDYNDDSIRHLDEKFGEIDCDRFLYCIQEQQKWDIEKVNHFIAQLRTSHLYALKELDRLKQLEPTYNKEYPTNHRRYVNTAQEVVSKMSIEVVKMSAVMTEKRKLAHLTAHDDQAQQLAFNRQIDAFIDDLEEKATESS